MMRIVLFVICTFTLSFYSCDRTGNSKQYLDRIDSLSLSLEKSAVGFETIDTASIHEKYHLIDSQLELLFTLNNNNDQADVNKYNNIRKTFFNVVNNYPAIIDELEYTRSQLSDLKYDIEHHNLDQENEEMYFSQEKQSVKVLKLKMDFYQEQLNSELIHFENIYPEIKKKLDSLIQ